MTMQRLTFLGSLKVYLEQERLATKEEIADILGGKHNFANGSTLVL